MAARKITDEHLRLISEWDLQGYKQQEMAAELGVSQQLVGRHLTRIRKERRQHRNEKADKFLDRLDDLMRQYWRASREPVVETRVDQAGTTVTTKMPPTAAGRLVLDIIKEQRRILGIGSGEDEEDPEAPQVVNVIVKDRDELKQAMSLGVFRNRLLPKQYDD